MTQRFPTIASVPTRNIIARALKGTKWDLAARSHSKLTIVPPSEDFKLRLITVVYAIKQGQSLKSTFLATFFHLESFYDMVIF